MNDNPVDKQSSMTVVVMDGVDTEKSAFESTGILSGYEVYHWPEFIALAKRLGIPIELMTVDLSITLTVDKVTVQHSYIFRSDSKRS